ncbi:MAG TPA: HAD-IB family phosphatase [Candidatus Nanoarchaeia archaeon]|nr:HAD-IB family phosphatase [Candidatus Nanoarchaeia archaeon]
MKVSCIIPAYNEESTIVNVLRNAKKVRTIHEIIVVDDGSTDNTYRLAKSEGVTVARHARNMGKGAAIKTGISHAKGDILLFLDADLYSISPKNIAAILQPLKNDDADFVKTSFTRARGRVTELVVKPLFRVVFPFMHFSQPLSGQFAMKRGLADELRIDDAWGVDIQILLQLVKKGVRIAEVDIGNLIHKKQPLESLTVMSEQVIKTILSELGIIANKHKLVVFDFDNTLVRESSIEVLGKEMGFSAELQRLRNLHRKKRIKDHEITLALAQILKGKTRMEIEDACRNIHLRRTTAKVIDLLKRRQYRVGIISVAFSPVVEYFAEKIGVDASNVICPRLVFDKDGICTGEVIAKTRYHSKCCDRILCKAYAAKDLMERLDVKPEECVAVGDGKTDECLFRACGLALAYRSDVPTGDVKILNLAEVLLYAE